MDLDNLEAYAPIDPSGMGNWIDNLAQQCMEARQIAEAVALPTFGEIRGVVILGMGGSAIGGDLVRIALEGEAKVPFIVNRDYELPGFVGPDTLVIASSYSGNTEETLAGYTEARKRGAMLLVIATGGTLVEWARRDGVTVIQIPGGISPRAALGYSFVPLLVTAWRLGLCADKSTQLDATIGLLEKLRSTYGREVPTEQNRPKQLAQMLYGRIPLFYGSAGYRSVVATRIKGQINENAKQIAFWNVFPELNHNELVGWEAPGLTRQIMLFVLRDRGESERIHTRIEVTEDIIRERVAGIEDLWAEGDSQLEKMFSLIYLGDYISYYLAMLNGIDPTPVKVIDRLKGELAKIG
jgi:glucose/mannose-6-phosphate isomerase